MRLPRLCKGIGKPGVSHCVLSAASIVAGETFSDEPSCVCPTLISALTELNERCPDDVTRSRLLGHLPWIIIGTRSHNINVAVQRAHRFAKYADSVTSKYAARDEATSAAIAAEHATKYATIYAATYGARGESIASKCAVSDTIIAANSAARYATVYAANVADEFAGDSTGFMSSLRPFVEFIEAKIISVHFDRLVEPGHRIDELVTWDV